MQKEIVGLHSPLHTIHYISNHHSEHHSPTTGKNQKKDTKTTKATDQDRILVETTTEHRNVTSNGHKLHRAPDEVLEPAPASNSAEPASGVVK